MARPLSLLCSPAPPSSAQSEDGAVSTTSGERAGGEQTASAQGPLEGSRAIEREDTPSWEAGRAARRTRKEHRAGGRGLPLRPDCPALGKSDFPAPVPYRARAGDRKHRGSSWAPDLPQLTGREKQGRTQGGRWPTAAAPEVRLRS